MSGSISDVEIIPGNGMTEPYPVIRPGRKSRRRLLVFLFTFFTCLIAGQIYNFQRTAVYRSSASLLTVALPSMDQPGTEADVQHVMLQRQKLLGKPLLDEVMRRLESDGSGVQNAGLTIYQLQSMLSVEPVPETHLVELQARGEDPALLALLANTWINSYLDLRVDEIKRVTRQTTDSLRTQYAGLEEKLKQKRKALDTFRKDNEILTLGRDENQILAKLKGLSDALNSANEEKVKAKSRLDAINAAVRDGRVVVPKQDERSLAQMEKRAQELREQLAELDRRFTRNYIALSPTLKVIPEKLQALERKIKMAVESGRSIVTNIANQEYVAARQTVTELQRQLDEHKRKATEFTTRFAEHEAQQEDLTSLEELYRGVEGRLVQIETENRQKYPQVKVVEWAFPPKDPVYPLYQRDALIVLAGAILAALLMALLVDFLSPRPKTDTTTTLTGVAMYPGVVPNSIGHSPEMNKLGSQQAPVLEHQQHGEISLQDINSFLQGADPAARWIVVLLLHGLSLEELLLISGGDFDPETRVLSVLGGSARDVVLSPQAVTYMPALDDTFPDWLDADGQLPQKQDLDARIKLAAVDAGLDAWDSFDTDLIRHSYIVYLIQQGIKLTELEQIIGRMSPQTLVGYRSYSPPGPGRLLSDIERVYPAFMGNAE